ncbi:Proclotting enzyme [Araneus ventricosus]|uniref:Proclotting enzyme n=1 Tax=Araneus ventricosus TaxID=182803 RepID=A0A4Y1ZXR4_ARAVE|nr:Proclotting enzyme [Araneus ventricosus]
MESKRYGEGFNTELKLRNLRATVKHGVGSHFVWGCMSSFGTGNLELIVSKVNKYSYLDILKRNIRQNAQKMGISANFKLYQDNDPKHTSHICRLWALYHCPMVIKTPAQSPDLNPIEHLWANIQQRLHENNITSKNILKEKLIEAWRNIDPNTCKKLVNSMPSRLKEEKMKVKLVLLFLVFICLSMNVEGKAVGKRIKRTVYSGSSYSLVPQSNTQWTSPEQKAADDMYWYKSSAVGESDYQSYASSSKLDEFAETSDPNHHSVANYDLESYENLEKMFDSEFVPQDLQNSRQEKYREQKLDSKVQKSKENDGPLESDQVFLHHETDKMSKYSSHEAKQDLLEVHPIGHTRGKEKSKTSISMIHSEANTDPHKRNLQSTMSTTQLPTASHQFEVEHSSDKLSFDSYFGSIPSELIHDLSESLEFNQRNLPTENESDELNLSESDLRAEDKRTPVSDNFASSLQENQLSDDFDSIINTEDRNLFRMGINQMFEANLDSFVFNPTAQPLEKFQACTTPKNESGSCRYVQHCMLPSILSSIQHFMENVCIIEGRFIGVCCPEFPVQTVLVKWEDQSENFSDRNNSVEIPQDCGIGTNTRIVGGNDADRKAWPWMVALLNNKNKFFCGGSLINNQYVITAAHCTFGTSKNQIVARLGEYDFNDPRDPHDDYRVVEVKRHGQYNSMSLRNDIALLKLEKPVAFNEFVKTICLPEAAMDYIGNVTTLVGWGHLNGGSGGTSDVLQEASFPVISNDQCSSGHRLPIPSSLICAAAVSRDKGACNGDSGGPLMLLDENDRWKVIGIVSWGRRGCNPKFPTVYTRVTHFMDWIRKHST